MVLCVVCGIGTGCFPVDKLFLLKADSQAGYGGCVKRGRVTYLLTRNITKALSVLMVDFSCALKLAMPISVLSAIREASGYHITVKGGKFLEAVAEADTIVFDKTGTLAKVKPTVVQVVSFNETHSLKYMKCRLKKRSIISKK